MEISKFYSISYEEYDDGKGVEDLLKKILDDPDLPDLKELVIGSWGNAWEDDCQELIDGIVKNAERFSNIESLFFGDMGYEDCEVSWIIQGDYSKLWDALPQLKEFTVKGSMDLDLGKINHENLESLTVICGGLPVSVIESVQNAKLPKLKKLMLYIGSDGYGFDRDVDAIKELLAESDFPELTYLGITNSEIQDELIEVVLNSKYMGQISTLDLSMGTLTDKGGSLLLEKIPEWKNIKKLDLHYHFLSDEMAEKLEGLPIEVDVSEGNGLCEDEDYYCMHAMLTE